MIACLAICLVLAGVFLYLINSRTDASTLKQDESKSQPSASASEIPPSASFTSVPILMYHYVRDINDPSDQAGMSLSVSPVTFDQQMSFLEQNNYQSINLTELANGYAGKFNTINNKKPIVITFDDGYDDAYTQAYPILKKHNLTATFYIISGQIGHSERMSAKQIISLDKNGMTIGSHTVSHPELTNISADQLNNQLLESKNTLETLLGHSVLDFCYPAGKYNADVINSVIAIGYKSAVTTDRGLSEINSNLFKLPRYRIQNDTNLKSILN